jgi:probable phosphoglycerate mutase
MRTVCVVTRPEATHHVEHLVGGWHDSELTAVGRRAAVRTTRALREQVPEYAEAQLFSSDLRRTRKTADAIARLLAVEPARRSEPRGWLASILDDRHFAPSQPVGHDR